MLYFAVTICAIVLLFMGIRGRANVRAMRELVRLWPQFQRWAFDKVNESKGPANAADLRWQTIRIGKIGIAYAIEHSGGQFIHRIGVAALSRFTFIRTQREFLMVAMAQMLPLLQQFPKDRQPKVDVARSADGTEMLTLWLSEAQHREIQKKLVQNSPT